MMSNIRMTVKKWVQIEFMISPQSKLVILPCFIMWIASMFFFSGVLPGCSLVEVQGGMVLAADIHPSRCSVHNPHCQSLGRRCASMEVS